MKIFIEEYNAEWKDKFREEKERIAKSLSGITFHIEHIGSTSIDGLGAKPIIDILIGLEDFSIANLQINKLAALGYQYLNQYEDVMPYRRFFIKQTAGISTFHIHMVQINSEFWNRHLAFRNYLRNNPTEKMEYYLLKKELAQRDWNDVNEYANAKTEFIKRIERKALSD